MNRIAKIVMITLAFSSLGYSQVNLRVPVISAGPTTGKVQWTAGTINNGGHPVAITAGNASLGASETSCASPSFSACDFLIANSGGTVSVTTSVATAQASGTTVMAIIETNGSSVPTTIVAPLQNGALWTNGLGFTGTFSAFTPATAGNIALGSNALPVSGVYIGTAATNNNFLTSTSTAAARTVDLGDAGANGAIAIADPTTPSKLIVLDAHSATASTTLTLADTLSASRTVTFTDPGGAANVAYANPTTAQALTGVSSITSSTASPASAGQVRLANADSIDWNNQAGNANLALTVNSSNNLTFNGTAPTDGYFFVPPGACGLTLTTGTWSANTAAGTSAVAGGFVIKAQTGNSVLEGTTTSAANTFDVTCDITPPIPFDG